jgi:glycosyltransferase involved in cell wall biosynthesis
MTQLAQQASDPMKPKLSIIIPAYNEEKRIGLSLDKVVTFVSTQAYPIEVLVVNNNSRDRTAEIIDSFVEEFPFMRRVDQPIQGKGAALRKGIMEGRGDILFIADADFSMPVEEIAKFMPAMHEGYDIAIGSRELPESNRVGEPEYRHIMGRVYNFVVRLFAIPKIHDTQCGFKAFKRDVAREIFPMQTIDGWGFDVEILYIALQRGYTLYEVPITWHYMPESRVNPLRDSIDMFLDVFRVRWNGLRGRYTNGA